jgi:DNA-binding NtrC family response regulator
MANIVVVDDDAAVRVLVAELLESDGHCVRQAIDGEHAVAVIQGQPPDIVVSDITMPELNGVELATLLSAETPGSPILLMSGACPAPSQAPARCLPKPFAADRLLLLVSDLLAA